MVKKKSGSKTTPKQAVVKIVKRWEQTANEAKHLNRGSKSSGNVRPHRKPKHLGKGTNQDRLGEMKKRTGGLGTQMTISLSPEKRAERERKVKKYGTLIVRNQKAMDHASKPGKKRSPSDKHVTKARTTMKSAGTRAKSKKK